MTLGKQLSIGAIAVIATTVLVYLILSFLPKTYRSHQTLYFPLSQTGGGLSALSSVGGGSMAIQDAVGITADSLSPLVGSSPSTAAGILQSRACLEYVVQVVGLEKNWDTSRNKAITKLKDSTSIEIDKNGLLVVSTKSESPELCVEILNTMHTFLVTKSDELTLNVGKENRQYLTERVQVLEGWANAAEKIYLEVMEGSDTVPSTEVGSAYLDLQSQLAQAKAQEESLAARINKLREVFTSRLGNPEDLPGQLEALKTVDPDATSPMGQTVAALALQLQQRKITFEDARKTYTPESTEYKNAQEHLKTTEAEVGTLIAEAKKNLENGTLPGLVELNTSLIGTRTANQELESALRSYKQILEEAPAASVRVTRASTAYRAALERLEAARSQLERARLLEQNDPARFEILDPAAPNDQPVAPRRAFMSGAWFLFASACAGWWILRSRVRFVD